MFVIVKEIICGRAQHIDSSIWKFILCESLPFCYTEDTKYITNNHDIPIHSIPFQTYDLPRYFLLKMTQTKKKKSKRRSIDMQIRVVFNFLFENSHRGKCVEWYSIISNSSSRMRVCRYFLCVLYIPVYIDLVRNVK